MRRHLHRLIALLLGCAMLCCPVFAANDCSLRVSITDNDDQPVPYFNVALSPITVFDGTAHTLRPEYADLGISAEALQSGLSQHAEPVYQYLMAQDLPAALVSTDIYGNASFSSLEQGIYLVFDRGDQIYTFPPYLVELPTQTDEGPLYHVNSAPKTVSSDSHTVLVAVVWIDDNNAAGKRPDNMSVTLTCHTDTMTGTADVVLNPNCRWQHTFHTLPYGGTYSVEGSEVTDYTLVFVEEVDEGFILYYQYTPTSTPTSTPTDTPDAPNDPNDPDDPSDPDNPNFPFPDGPFYPNYPVPTPPAAEETLPQTGFRMLPVYALLGLGSLLVILGLADVCTRRREEP